MLDFKSYENNDIADIFDEFLILETIRVKRNLDLSFESIYNSVTEFLGDFIESIKFGFFFDEFIDNDLEHLSYFKKMAKVTNSSEYYLAILFKIFELKIDP